MKTKKFKEWTVKQVEKFCEDNFIEDDEWLFHVVEGSKAYLENDKYDNLVIIIQNKR